MLSNYRSEMNNWRDPEFCRQNMLTLQLPFTQVRSDYFFFFRCDIGLLRSILALCWGVYGQGNDEEYIQLCNCH